ncbi:hypothetical protein M422DRAFT_32329 [Sphaerobolus stellatus SS14]|uniref:Uncharacterized protein n=1 Tax=Sphaerobolus stellatus (strain SS14) TaxID=990650 RepID=A0A0C9VQV6_SPHS4|nr:hypothetical protein M422DRAFT_32329 [Sphaerobolus stellatus SS14]
MTSATATSGVGAGGRGHMHRPDIHIPSTIMEAESPRASMLVEEHRDHEDGGSDDTEVQSPSPPQPHVPLAMSDTPNAPRPISPLSDGEGDMDTASLSSYETGHETLDVDYGGEEEEERHWTVPVDLGVTGYDVGVPMILSGVGVDVGGGEGQTPVHSSVVTALPQSGFALTGPLTPPAEPQGSVQSHPQPQATAPSHPQPQATAPSHPDPPAPSVPPKYEVPEGYAESHPLSQAYGSTATLTGSGDAPARRKSVRLSNLPPQVLNRTPSGENVGFDFNDNDEGEETPQPQQHSSHSSGRRHSHGQGHTSQAVSASFGTGGTGTGTGGGQGWTSRIGGGSAGLPNVWDDSEEEDEEYVAAKKALERLHAKGDQDFGARGRR